MDQLFNVTAIGREKLPLSPAGRRGNEAQGGYVAGHPHKLLELTVLQVESQAHPHPLLGGPSLGQLSTWCPQGAPREWLREADRVVCPGMENTGAATDRSRSPSLLLCALGLGPHL